MGNTSFFLSGRAADEVAKGWQPNWAAVRAAIRFKTTMGRLAAVEREAAKGATAGTAPATTAPPAATVMGKKNSSNRQASTLIYAAGYGPAAIKRRWTAGESPSVF
jgi:TPP-dependent trihydroxycyclohexane-1,2-dione (THcHDO) dehydratase